MITAENFHRVEELFHEARALAPADRAMFLDARCAGALDLRAEVESLLAHADRDTERFDMTPDASATATVLVERGPISEGPGTRIGPYKILQQIGEGGFGVVYMAEQQEPVQRLVALKIIKLGMDTKQVIARFEAERQALAMMDHPNIARVLEAGATETGRPYFVMELVRGIPITAFCDRQKLATNERLRLFLQVCHAVQHAHQKGIIHRDLKPSNVLVTLHDTTPVPKVIDFGIAKATSRRLTEKTLFTEFRQFVGTPEYMSPDQAEISGLDIDTRADIYSLGVVLYELLTGTTPFDPTTLRNAAYGEIQRIIREVEPPRPSTRVDTLIAEETDVAHDRRVEARQLSRLIRGDLDWVVMKAMEKDRTRRYQTASELSADIERYLARQPVAAGPPGVTYRLARFVRRHHLGVTAAVIIAAALVTGTALATVGLVEARQEARRSQRIADFLQELFVSTSPEQSIAQDLDVERVLATAREVFGEDHAAVAAVLSSRGLQLQSGGSYEEAEAMYRESLRLWRERFGDEDIHVGTTLSRLGVLLSTKGDGTAAEETLREAIRVTGSLPVGETVDACEPMLVLAGMLSERGEYDEAEQLFRESIRIREAVAPHQRLQIAIAWNALAGMLSLAGRDEAAAEAIPPTLEAWRRALPPDGVMLARVMTQVGIWYLQHDRPDEAEPVLGPALEIFRAHPDSATHHHALAARCMLVVTERRGDPAATVPIAMEVLDLAGETDGGRRRSEALQGLASLAWEITKTAARPVAEYELALRACERTLVDEPDSGAWLNTRGILEYRLGRDEQALATLARSNEFYSQQHETGVPADLAFMAMAHHRLGHEAEARETMKRLRAAMLDPAIPCTGDNAVHLAEAEAMLGDLHPADEPRGEDGIDE